MIVRMTAGTHLSHQKGGRSRGGSGVNSGAVVFLGCIMIQISNSDGGCGLGQASIR